MTQLHSTPASIAAALRSAADQLDLMGQVEISPTRLLINLQPVSYRGTFEQRRDTVDALSIALAGETGETENDADPHHRLDFEHTGKRGDCDVAIYTAVKDFTPGGNR